MVALYVDPKDRLIVLIYRISNLLRGIPTLALLISYINIILFSIDINPKAQIGKGFVISHGLGTVIGPCKIGKNVNIKQNVTIGNKENDAEEFPIIGDNVIIYSNCVIVGKIKVGNNSVVGACTFVNKDIPEDTIVYNNKKLITKKRII